MFVAYLIMGDNIILNLLFSSSFSLLGLAEEVPIFNLSIKPTSIIIQIYLYKIYSQNKIKTATQIVLRQTL